MKELSPVALFAIYVFICFVIAIPQAVLSQKSAPLAVANGKRIFNQSCSACHDTLGAITKSGPGLKSYYRHQPRPADAAVRAIIHQGKGKMPAFSTLDKSQTDELVAYLRTL
jgi:mono/diheme cytochrome c family protein